MAAAVKYFHENAEQFNINSDQIAIGGASGGGYTTMIASILLAREDKAHMVNLQILENANLGPCLDDTPVNIVQPWEKALRNLVPYDLIATDYETQNKERDPLLFPLFVTLEEAAKLPKTVLFTSEFDPIRRSSHQIIPTLKRAGVYLDHGDYAGSAHCFFLFPYDPNTPLWFKDMQKVFGIYMNREKDFIPALAELNIPVGDYLHSHN